MSGIGIKADEAVLAAETPSSEACRTVFGGRLRRNGQLALLRREILVIAHANDNAPAGRVRPRLRVVPGASANGPAGSGAPVEEARR